jgi:trk system potassium uptake protein TrkH
MILFGVNFNIYYFLLIKNLRAAYKNDELRAYAGILAVSMLLIALNLTGTVYQGFATALRYASFQVGSIMTTTGFATADFSTWPMFSRVILLFLMVIGASAGSTAGGLKVSRIVIIVKESRRFLTRMANPRSVAIIRMDEKTVDKTVVHGVNVYTITLMLITAASFLLLSLENYDLETTFSAVLACVNNVGPGLSMVSPIGNFAFFSPFSKIVLILDMLLGRLEIYPLLLLMSPKAWRR